MNEYEFIENLKADPDWNEFEYVSWLAASNPEGTELEQISQFLSGKCPEFSELEMVIWNEEHLTAESPELTFLMETIIYQWYLIYLKYVRGINYI